MSSFQNQDTILIHGGHKPDPTTGALALPIYQTTSYAFRDTEHAQNLFGLKESGNIYSRIMNPTVDAFEQRISLLEDGAGAVAASSGMAAITMAIFNLASSGDEIISDSNLYGGTYNLFRHTLPRYGIQVKFVDGTNPSAFKEAITDKTKAIFAETITNPSLNVFDMEAVADIAHESGIPLIIDNTFGIYTTKPVHWGADIVIHSATKWIGGHGTSLGGVVVDAGRFNWDNERFPGFTEPDESYHGLRYADLGPTAFATKLRVQILRDIGAALSPQHAFQFVQGLETLHLRIERHSQNAEQVAEYLTNHPAVEWVNYPGLENHPSHELAKKYFKDGLFGSIITFGIKGGRDAGRKLIDGVNLWSHVANVGDVKSLIIHPASTTHQQLNAEELKESGTTEELVRLSVGLENTEDIIADLDQSLSAATGEESAYVDTEKTAIESLLFSPFDRSNGGIRQKVLAAFGSDTESIKRLEKSGFQVISITDADKGLGELTIDVDAVYINQAEIPDQIIEQLNNKQVKLLWKEHNDIPKDIADQAKAAGITVITNKNPYKSFLRLRGEIF